MSKLMQQLTAFKTKKTLKSEINGLSERIQQIESGIREFRKKLKTKRGRSDKRRKLAKLTKGAE